MTKKSGILIATILLFLFFSYQFFTSNTPTKKNDSTTNININNLYSNDYTPSFSELKKKLGKDTTDLGEYQIVTVIFNNKNIAYLENNKGETIELDFVIKDKDDLTFSINKITPKSNEFKIEDKLSIARNNDEFYLYSTKK